MQNVSCASSRNSTRQTIPRKSSVKHQQAAVSEDSCKRSFFYLTALKIFNEYEIKGKHLLKIYLSVTSFRKKSIDEFLNAAFINIFFHFWRQMESFRRISQNHNFRKKVTISFMLSKGSVCIHTYILVTKKYSNR